MKLAAAQVTATGQSVCPRELASQRAYLVRFAQRKLRDPMLAEDVVHDVFEAVLAGSARVKDVAVDWIIKMMTGKEIDLDQVYRPARPVGKMLLEVHKLSGTGFSDISFSLR